MANRRAAPNANPRSGAVGEEVARVVAWLEAHGTKATRDGMARYAIPSTRAFGVAMRDLKALAKQVGRDHQLALALWETGWYEARIVTAFIADPEEVSSRQMDNWCKQLDDWATCDTLAFHLFDRTLHAWAQVDAWSRRKGEFEKRAAFAPLWSLALHDKRATDDQFLYGLALRTSGDDDRNFVKKAVSMALRAIGKRRPTLAPPRPAPSRACSRRRTPLRGGSPETLGLDVPDV